MTRDDIIRMAIEAGGCTPEWDDFWELHDDALERFAALVTESTVRKCVNTLEFHGFDDAIPHIKWMAANKLGVKE